MIDEAWTALIKRIEDDVRARSSDDVSSFDDSAWQMASIAIRNCAEILSSRSRLSAEELDEIVQEILLKLQSTKTLRRIKSAGSPAGYLVVMIRNGIVDRLRRRQRAAQLEIPLDDTLLSVPGLYYSEEDPNLPKLRRALASLRSEDLALLRLRFWRNLSIQEIAERSNLKYSATAVRLFRILRTLRAKLESQ
jgi:RNA polymerase sigma factor (sigma-70 family)